VSITSRIKDFLAERIGREALAPRVRGIKTFLEGVSKGAVINFFCLAAIVTIAALIRLQPIRWGFYLSEFDPYQQYRMTEYVVKNGFTSWFSWYDHMTWYPWGRDIPTTNYPGVAFSAAIVYLFLKSIGIEMGLYRFCVLFPVIMGAATCLAQYFLGRDVWSRSVALLSSLFLAFNSSHVFRTSAGFFDDETIGIFAMLLFFMFYIRSISPNKSNRASLLYAILAGLALSYMSLGWGAFRYPMSLVALFSAVLVIIGRYSRRLLLSYGVTYGLNFLIMSQLPYLGFSFLKEWSTVAIFGVLLFLCLYELFIHLKSVRQRTIAVLCFFGLVGAAAFVLWQQGLIVQIGSKFWTVLNPSTRLDLPLVESVAEHRPATWASFFFEFGIISLLGIFGFFFASQRLRNSDIFLILFGLSSLYFASSLVRLTLILAPALSLMAAVTVIELGKPSVDILREAVIFPRRKTRFVAKVGREFGVAILLILLLIIMPTFYRASRAAYSPATIVTSSLPTVEQQPSDWLEALTWMKENLPQDAVVFSWWDYGYWITTMADKRTLADNGTINSTQIAIIAMTFLSNETKAVPVLKKYNVTHITIFITWYKQQQQQKIGFYGYGEESKWYWMAKISNGTTYGNETVRYYEKAREGEGGQTVKEYYRVVTAGNRTISNQTIADSNGLFPSSILGFLMIQGISPGSEPESNYFEQVFASSNRFVFVYKVLYAETTSITCRTDRSNITYGEGVEISGTLLNSTKGALADQKVTLECSTSNGTSWSEISTTTTSENGTYSYSWKPNAGSYLIHARFQGAKGSYVSSVSPNLPLTVNKANAAIALGISPISIVLGQNATISCNVTPRESGGRVILEYSTDNKTWTPLTSGDLVNGSYSTSWAPKQIGTIYIRATWTGNLNYNRAVSSIQILTVSKE
jgi:dolichyl-diphosphooligosaccharide--protein glycosyltransferase